MLASFPAGQDYTTSFAVSPNGELALIGGPKSAKLVRIADGAVNQHFGDGWISGVGFLSDRVVLVRDHAQLALYTTDGKMLCSDQKLETGVLDLNPNGLLVGGASHQRDILVWPSSVVTGACNAISQ